MSEVETKSDAASSDPTAANATQAADGKAEDTKAKKKASSPGEFLTTIVVAVLIALTFRTFAYEPFNIPSGSMYPNLLVGDYLLVSKFSYGYSKHSFPWSLGPFDGRIFESQVERGDIAVFKEPKQNRQDYIKRIIGLPGDRIQMVGGTVHINGKPVKRERIENFVHPDTGVVQRMYRDTLPNGVSYLNLTCVIGKEGQPLRDVCASAPADNTGVYIVPEDHYFAMGDNRHNSLDSRVSRDDNGIGFVPAENLVGRADIIFFSACGKVCGAAIYKPWTWFGAMRYDRFFDVIR